jgi:hypothetical protein
MGAATEIAGQVAAKVDERNKTLELASLNSAKLELETQGQQLALDMQKDRVAGSEYVSDLTKERQKLKTDVWAKLPSRVQKSARAQQAWDSIWTADEISASKSATVWQADQEQKFAVNSLQESLNAMTARIEANPDSVQNELNTWKNDPVRGVQAYKGLLTADQLATVDQAANYSVTLSTVRGLATQDRVKEAEAVITKTGGMFDEEQRASLTSTVEGIQTDKRQALALAEAERVKGQKLTANRIEVDILDGKANRATINAAVERGEISVNDQPALIRAYQSQQDRAVALAKMSPEEKARLAVTSADIRLVLSGLPREMRANGRDGLPAEYRALYDRLTPDDARAVRKDMADIAESAGTVNLKESALNDLLSTAKFMVPAEWKITGQEPTKDGAMFRGLVSKYAEEFSARGGKDMTTEDARKLIARALVATNGKGFKATDNSGKSFKLPLDMQMTDQGIDVDLMQETEAMLTTKLGRAPTVRELMNAYKQVAP